MPELIRSLLLVGGLTVMAQVIAATTAERTRLTHGFQQQARSDYLTGLYNDRGFSRRLERALQQDMAKVHSTWLIYMTVLEADRIKDLLGFEDSERFEQLLAAILISTVGPDSHPARIRDASYVMLLDAADRTNLSQELNRIHDRFDGQVLEPGAQQIQIRIAIGAVPLDSKLRDHTHYLSTATEAALLAGSQARRIRVIDNIRERMQKRQSTSLQIEQLKSALSENRLELYAQRIEPFSENETGLHYEILLRLRGRDASLIGPGDFLPVAETFGFMLEIDQWVVATTLTTLAAHPEWLDNTSKCAINLAGASLSSGEVASFIEEQLSKTEVTPEKLSFEITETAQISDRDTAEQQVRAIRALGCSVSLDDFGTGLATFDYLRSFELDYIKIDGVFVRDLLENRNDQSMVKAICQVAHTMNLRTVAEFVEGDEMVSALTSLGVNYGQGFGIARPCPLRELFSNTRGVPQIKTVCRGTAL